MTITEERVSFNSGSPGGDPTQSLELEGALHGLKGKTPRAGAVVFAPHPLYGGNFDNNVVRSVTSGLSAAGLAVLRFNYRGVGQSDVDPGSPLRGQAYWEHVDREKLYDPIVDDGEAAVGFLRQHLDSDVDLHLVGYSFGATISGLLAVRFQEALTSAVLVAPPLNRLSFAFLADLASPYGLVLAKHDTLYGKDDIANQVAAAPPGFVDVLETDHFFRGYENAVADRVKDFLTQNPAVSGR